MCILLLVIPYITRGYEMSMRSQGRFAAVVVVNYLVLGKLLSVVPSSLAGIAVGMAAAVLALWSALYAAGFLFF